MAYDPGMGGIVLFGGYDGNQVLGDTWLGSGSGVWGQLSPATSPTARQNAAMAYDPATQQLVLFGGWDGTEELGDTWTWNGSTWTEMFPASSPSPRDSAAMAYDAATGQLLLFGGAVSSSSGVIGDTWTWNGATWTQLDPPTSPSPRSAASMSYDSNTGQLVLFGGSDLNDTWTWSGSTWTELFPASSPSPRFSATMAYDGITGQIVLFGGEEGTYPYLLNDTWTWDGSTWTQQSLGAAPPARFNASMAYDATSYELTLFGGEAQGPLGDTWVWQVIADPPTISSVSPSSGLTTGGTNVTIDGTNLDYLGSVTFGGANATVLSDSPTSITVTTPPGSAGPVDVVVNTAGGSVTYGGGFFYLQATPPAIVSVSPASGAAVGGTVVTISGVFFTGATAVDFGVNPAQSFTVVSDTQITATTPLGAAGVTAVSVTTPSGTGTQPDAFTYLVTNCEPPSITSADVATATAGTPFSFPVTTCASSVPTIKRASGLPMGLVLTDNRDGTATISGTPSAKDTGSNTTTILAFVNGQPTATQELVITVDNSGVFGSKAKDLVHTGMAFSYAITTRYAYPAPTITTSSTLPGGVTLTDNGNGTASLGGSPDADSGGTYPITISAANGVGSPVIQAFTLTVYQASVVTSPNADTIAAGVAMTPFEVTATGYPTPTLKAAGLPYGLRLVDNHNGTATISGTPRGTAAGTYNVSVIAASKAGSTTQPFTLAISP